jgi:hypothetical protein
MKIINIIESIIKEVLEENVLYKTIYNLKYELALAGQKIYDQWDQDEDGYDEEYGSGGICDDIADAMCDVINNKTEYECFHLYNEYDCHTSIYVYDSNEKLIYNVDIPPYIYEKGTGYNWKKIKNIKFIANHVDINEVDWDDFFDEDGDLKNDWN